MRKSILLIFPILVFIGCNDKTASKEVELLKKENRLLKKELELDEKHNRQEQTKKQKIEIIDVKKETQKLFDRYAPEIEKTNNARIGNSEFIIGDINYDGLEDAIAFFVLAPVEGGNMILGNGMAVYLNRGDKMEVVAGYNPENRFRPVEIKNNKIHIIEYEYAKDDYPSRPSIERHKYLILNGNKLTESRVFQ